MSEIRPNLAKRKLLRGLPVLAPSMGARSLPDNDTLELLATHGNFDVAWIEMEHGPFTWSDLGDIARVCDLGGLTSLVRVPMNDIGVIGRTLDRGVQSVMVPHVNTRADAERIVQAAYYAPMGIRGIASPRQSYGVKDYFARINDEILTIALIEEQEAIDNLDDILQVDGIDVFFVGPSDLGQSMGPQYVGNSMHPDVQAVVMQTLKRIKDAGRISGTSVSAANLKEVLDAGARMLRYQTNAYLVNGLNAFKDQVEKIVPA